MVSVRLGGGGYRFGGLPTLFNHAAPPPLDSPAPPSPPPPPLPPPPPPPPAANSFLGVQTHFAQGMANADLAASIALGLPIARVRDEFYWAAVEATAGVYTFSGPSFDFDATVTAVHAAGAKIIFTADWSNVLYDTDMSRGAGQGFPDNPTCIAKYIAFILKVLDRYSGPAGMFPGIIECVEVWNEFNGTWNGGYANNSQAAATAYTALLHAVYDAVKARPEYVNLPVLGCATVLVPSGYLDLLGQAGAFAFMDGAALHPYYSTADQIPFYLGLAKEVFTAYGKPDLPIWATEFAVFSDDTAEAVYLLSAIAIFKSMPNVYRASWYLLRDFTPASAFTGLVNEAVTALQAAGTTWAAYADLISGAVPIGNASALYGAFIYQFVSAEGVPFAVCWRNTSITADIDVVGTHTVKNYLGATVTPAASYALEFAPIVIFGAVTIIVDTGGDIPVGSWFGDFSFTQGPNWFYLYREAGADVQLVTDKANNQWYKPGDTGYIQPGAFHPGISRQFIRRFIVGFSGNCKITGSWARGASGDGTGCAIVRKTGAGHGTKEYRLYREALLNSTVTLGQIFAVVAGDYIDFVCDSGGNNNPNFDVTGISMTIWQTADTVNSADIVGSPPLADSVDDFSPIDGSGGWNYIYTENDTEIPLPWYPDGNEYALSGDTALISSGGQHPGIVRPTIRRWTCPVTARISIKGSVGRGPGGDGTGFRLSRRYGASHASRAVMIYRPFFIDETIVINQVIDVAAGDFIDFECDSGQSGDPNFDALGLSARIRTAPGTTLTSPDISGDVLLVSLAEGFSYDNGGNGLYYFAGPPLTGDPMTPDVANSQWSYAGDLNTIRYNFMHPGSLKETSLVYELPVSGMVKVTGNWGRGSGGDGTRVLVQYTTDGVTFQTLQDRLLAAPESRLLYQVFDAGASPGGILSFSVSAGAANEPSFDGVGFNVRIWSTADTATSPDI